MPRSARVAFAHGDAGAAQQTGTWDAKAALFQPTLCAAESTIHCTAGFKLRNAFSMRPVTRPLLQRLSLSARLTLISGSMLLLAGSAVLAALTLRDAAAWQATLQQRAADELDALALSIADPPLGTHGHALQARLDARARAPVIRSIEWTGRDGTVLRSSQAQIAASAPAWFESLLGLHLPTVQRERVAGGAHPGRLAVQMNAQPAVDQL